MELQNGPLRWALPVLLLLAILELVYLRRQGRAVDWRASASSLFIAVGQHASAMLAAGMMGLAFLWAWEHRLWTVPMPTWWGVALLFIGQEFFYYWQHRLSHEVRWFWASHSVHHSPHQFNLSASYRLSWTAPFTGQSLFLLPLPLLGFHPLAVFMALGLNLLYQFWLHTELVPKLGWFDRVFNSPSNHRVHHASNLAYLDANYGGVLIVFDRLFGTWIPERDGTPCEYGLVKPHGSNNPFVILFHEWMALWRDLRAARTAGAVAGHVFGPPGWRADGTGRTTRALRAEG